MKTLSVNKLIDLTINLPITWQNKSIKLSTKEKIIGITAFAFLSLASAFTLPLYHLLRFYFSNRNVVKIEAASEVPIQAVDQVAKNVLPIVLDQNQVLPTILPVAESLTRVNPIQEVSLKPVSFAPRDPRAINREFLEEAVPKLWQSQVYISSFKEVMSPMNLMTHACFNRCKTPLTFVLERKIVYDADQRFSKAEPLVYVSLGSGMLLQDWIIIAQLMIKGFNSFEIHLIDTIYREEDDQPTDCDPLTSNWKEARELFEVSLKAFNPIVKLDIQNHAHIQSYLNHPTAQLQQAHIMTAIAFPICNAEEEEVNHARATLDAKGMMYVANVSGITSKTYGTIGDYFSIDKKGGKVIPDSFDRDYPRWPFEKPNQPFREYGPKSHIGGWGALYIDGSNNLLH